MSKYDLLQHPKYFFEKKSHSAEKLKGETLWDFSTSILSQNSKKIEGDPSGEKIRKKSRTMPKKTERGPFSLARYCMLRGKKEKPFWFSSLGQQEQFKILWSFW